MSTPQLLIIAASLTQQPQWVVPAGFHVTVFADSVENAREMALGPHGTVFVGSMRAGKVYAVIDRDGDHKADRVVAIASGLNQPNGVAIHNGALYVATSSKLLRFDDIERHLDATQDYGADVVGGDLDASNSAGTHAATLRRCLSVAQFHGKSLPSLWIV